MWRRDAMHFHWSNLLLWILLLSIVLSVTTIATVISGNAFLSTMHITSPTIRQFPSNGARSVSRLSIHLGFLNLNRMDHAKERKKKGKVSTRNYFVCLLLAKLVEFNIDIDNFVWLCDIRHCKLMAICNWYFYRLQKHLANNLLQHICHTHTHRLARTNRWHQWRRWRQRQQKKHPENTFTDCHTNYLRSIKQILSNKTWDNIYPISGIFVRNKSALIFRVKLFRWRFCNRICFPITLQTEPKFTEPIWADECEHEHVQPNNHISHQNEDIEIDDTWLFFFFLFFLDTNKQNLCIHTMRACPTASVKRIRLPEQSVYSICSANA